ncbi:MAG: hypothetical protein KC548_04460 [Nanoarchaeota archaeon]|nr:hypothetical protein [Nanoarchaeota archaeon]
MKKKNIFLFFSFIILLFCSAFAQVLAVETENTTEEQTYQNEAYYTQNVSLGDIVRAYANLYKTIFFPLYFSALAQDESTDKNYLDKILLESKLEKEDKNLIQDIDENLRHEIGKKNLLSKDISLQIDNKVVYNIKVENETIVAVTQENIEKSLHYVFYSDDIREYMVKKRVREVFLSDLLSKEMKKKVHCNGISACISSSIKKYKESGFAFSMNFASEDKESNLATKAMAEELLSVLRTEENPLIIEQKLQAANQSFKIEESIEKACALQRRVFDKTVGDEESAAQTYEKAYEELMAFQNKLIEESENLSFEVPSNFSLNASAYEGFFFIEETHPLYLKDNKSEREFIQLLEENQEEVDVFLGTFLLRKGEYEKRSMGKELALSKYEDCKKNPLPLLTSEEEMYYLADIYIKLEEKLAAKKQEREKLSSQAEEVSE